MLPEEKRESSQWAFAGMQHLVTHRCLCPHVCRNSVRPVVRVPVSQMEKLQLSEKK